MTRSFTALLAGILAACATPAERYDARASAAGFAPVVLQGQGFRHQAYAAGSADRAGTLHVYIEHDGTPWLEPARVAADPTPRTPVALELMARDAGARLLLGRPCYFALDADPGCGPLLWTHRRYSADVVASMATALRAYLTQHAIARVVLIGYSGGGTLAWLMAAQMPEAIAVITVAANLDVDRWAALHGYSPLSGSLNPVLRPPLSPGVAQVNYAGGRDANVPPELARAFAAHHPGARVVVLADFDHECCWAARWPQLLDEALGPVPQPSVTRSPAGR